MFAYKILKNIKTNRFMLLSIFMGFAVFSLIVLVLNLPSEIGQGENGQESIQRLGELRHSFLVLQR